MAVNRKYSLIFVSKQMVPFKKDRPLQLMLSVYIVLFVFLAFNPVDYYEWWCLSIPSAIIIASLAAFYRQGRLTNLSYFCVLFFLILHALGAHYTYALCPVGEWMKGLFGFARNNYDRLVCMAFGLLISLPVMETLYHRFRLRYIEACLISVFFIVAFCALYSVAEMLFCAVSRSLQMLILSEIQGDMWYAQRDTAISLLGAVLNMGTLILLKIRRNQRIHMIKLSK